MISTIDVLLQIDMEKISFKESVSLQPCSRKPFL